MVAVRKSERRLCVEPSIAPNRLRADISPASALRPPWLRLPVFFGFSAPISQHGRSIGRLQVRSHPKFFEQKSAKAQLFCVTYVRTCTSVFQFGS